MSGTFPSIGWRAANLRGQNFNYSSESKSGRKQVRNRGGHRWQFTAVFPPMTRSAFSPVMAFIESQEGMLGTFQVTIPILSSTSGTVSGTAAASASASVGAKSVSIDGITGTLKAGNFVKFANHSKVYMLTADRAGDGSMAFTPALVAAVADNEVVTYTDVPFTVRITNDVQEYPANTAVHFNYEVDMEEAI